MIPNTFIVIIGLSVSGYIFLSNTYRYKYRVPKYQGHHLIYRIISTGILFYITSILLFSYLSTNSTFNSIYEEAISFVAFLDTENTNSNTLQLTITSLASVILSIGCAFIWNFLLKSRISISEFFISNSFPSIKDVNHYLDVTSYLEATDSEFIHHFMSMDAQRPSSLTLLSLASRRCYVCVPYEIKPPRDSSEHQELSIIPLASGFRHSEDLCLQITTYYWTVIDVIRKSNKEFSKLTPEEQEQEKYNIESYRITVPIKEIVTMADFNLSEYKQFKSQENKERAIIKRSRSEEK